MKTRNVLGLAAIAAVFAFSSCKKDYTCTCTTTVGNISTTNTYNLKDQRITDATEACDRFEDDLNRQNGPATTNCNL